VNGTFFDILHVPKNVAKQLKSRDPYGDLTLTPMPKSISEKKICSIHKNSVCVYTWYERLCIGYEVEVNLN
jgi:hypothetical protein